MRYLLHIVQNLLDILLLLQVSLEDGGRGSSRKPLADREAAGVLEGVEHLSTQKACSSSDKDGR